MRAGFRLLDINQGPAASCSQLERAEHAVPFLARSTVPVHIMDRPLRRPEQILAYRPLQQILAAKPRALWTVEPRDSALAAMHLMADKNIGFLVVVENAAIVGVLSERDCVRRLV